MINKKIRIAAVLATVTALVSGASVALPANAATTATSRYITVSADGVVKVVPDAVRLNATVSIVASTNAAALSKTSTSAAAVRAALTANSIAKTEIATQSITVYPEYQYTQETGSVLIGYRGSQSFVVTIKNPQIAGAVVDAVVAAGGDNVQIQGVTPFILDTTKSTASARTAAVRSAKAKATSYASLLGVKLGKVKYLVENSSPLGYIPPIAMAKADSGETVVDLGQQEVTVSISVQWSLL
jgi:uncharacterized protein YggE